jgi:hypothetical protein
MVPGNEDARQRARKKAEALQGSLEMLVAEQADTEEYLERLDKVAFGLFELAQDWDSVNPQIAARVRQQETQVRNLRKKVEHLGELEAEEAEQVMREIREALHQA